MHSSASQAAACGCLPGRGLALPTSPRTDVELLTQLCREGGVAKCAGVLAAHGGASAVQPGAPKAPTPDRVLVPALKPLDATTPHLLECRHHDAQLLLALAQLAAPHKVGPAGDARDGAVSQWRARGGAAAGGRRQAGGGFAAQQPLCAASPLATGAGGDASPAGTHLKLAMMESTMSSLKGSSTICGGGMVEGAPAQRCGGMPARAVP
jgi:hypothetical protein